MSRFIPDTNKFSCLKDKVVVITGGADGIGLATLKAFHAVGAKVVFGDLNEEAGPNIAKTLSPDIVKFIKTDVRNYEDHIALFELALKSFGRVDIAVSNAGVGGDRDYMDLTLDLESVKSQPPNVVVDVNLVGTMYFTRVATCYLRQNQTVDDDKLILLMGSTASFADVNGMSAYQVSKHGVLGLMRSLRGFLPKVDLRINTICPAVVDTNLAKHVAKIWRENNLAVNTADGIANVMVGIAADKSLNGGAYAIAGDHAYEFDKNISNSQAQWLGKEITEEFQKSQAYHDNLSRLVAGTQSGAN